MGALVLIQFFSFLRMFAFVLVLFSPFLMAAEKTPYCALHKCTKDFSGDGYFCLKCLSEEINKKELQEELQKELQKEKLRTEIVPGVSGSEGAVAMHNGAGNKLACRTPASRSISGNSGFGFNKPMPSLNLGMFTIPAATASGTKSNARLQRALANPVRLSSPATPPISLEMPQLIPAESLPKIHNEDPVEGHDLSPFEGAELPQSTTSFFEQQLLEQFTLHDSGLMLKPECDIFPSVEAHLLATATSDDMIQSLLQELNFTDAGSQIDDIYTQIIKKRRLLIQIILEKGDVYNLYIRPFLNDIIPSSVLLTQTGYASPYVSPKFIADILQILSSSPLITSLRAFIMPQQELPAPAIFPPYTQAAPIAALTDMSELIRKYTEAIRPSDTLPETNENLIAAITQADSAETLESFIDVLGYAFMDYSPEIMERALREGSTVVLQVISPNQVVEVITLQLSETAQESIIISLDNFFWEIEIQYLRGLLENLIEQDSWQVKAFKSSPGRI